MGITRAWPQAFRIDGAMQTVSTTASSAATTNPVDTQTRYVRLYATQDCHVTSGSGTPTASTANLFLPAGQPEYFKVNPGERVAAIRSTLDGTLYVSEMTS